MKGPKWPLPTDVPSEHKKGPGLTAISGLIVPGHCVSSEGFSIPPPPPAPSSQIKGVGEEGWGWQAGAC